MLNRSSEQALAQSFLLIFCVLECVGHSFVYVTHLRFWKMSGLEPRELAVTRRRVINLATYPPNIFFLIHNKK